MVKRAGCVVINQSNNIRNQSKIKERLWEEEQVFQWHIIIKDIGVKNPAGSGNQWQKGRRSRWIQGSRVCIQQILVFHTGTAQRHKWEVRAFHRKVYFHNFTHRVQQPELLWSPSICFRTSFIMSISLVAQFLLHVFIIIHSFHFPCYSTHISKKTKF